MKPGRELDALVAEKVMGWKRILSPEDARKCLNAHSDIPPAERVFQITELMDTWVNPAGKTFRGELPEYSTDIAAAWEIVEKLKALGYGYCIECVETEPDPTVWFLHKNEEGPRFHCLEEMVDRVSGSGPFPLAVCLAALRVVGENVP